MGNKLRRQLAPERTAGNLNTFAGVFTPSILTILGIILFLRLGFVVGSAGLARALVIIALANILSILTTISLSAIATNLKVKGGGDYYLISRTLGVEFGGAIGIVLFLAQSVSIAFYAIGFGEAVSGMLQIEWRFLPQIIAALAVSFLFIFAWLGADWATKFQYLVMTILALALVSFYIGAATKWNSWLLEQNWSATASDLSFWALFAVFFPAVTGFTQGVSMSGDLKDPGKSLPLGTFAAVGISAVVYLSMAILFAAALPEEILRNDYASMKRVSGLSFLVDAGVIAATLSSGMASFLGAPRILQSMARDRIMPFLLPFAKGAGVYENPRRGVLLSAGIAFAVISLGNLNLIASVVSMFFLISYGLLNYATFFEAKAASPSFRPRFRWFDARLSLLGSLSCGGVMLAIAPAAGLVAIAVLFSVYQYLKRTAGPARWADSRRSYHLQQVREHLQAAAKEPEHSRDWRPQLLAFSDNPKRRKYLLSFASWIEGPSGFTTAVRILEGEGLPMLKKRAEAEKQLREDLSECHPQAFPLAIAAPNLSIGIETLVQSFGIGPLQANTILLNWLERVPWYLFESEQSNYGRNLRAVFRLGCNIVILNAEEQAWTALETVPSAQRRIDVWWWGDSTSRLMLLFAYLMTRSEKWSGARIRVMGADSGQDYEETVEALKKTLEWARITAEPEVVLNTSVDAVIEQSANAAMVFLPFRLKGNELVGPFGGNMESLLSRLQIASVCLAAEDIDLDAEPEEGKSAEIAAAFDAYSHAKKRLQDAKREAAEAQKDAEEKVRKLRDPTTALRDEKTRLKLAEDALAAKDREEKAMRRVAREQAKMIDAAQEMEEQGGPPVNEKSENQKGK